MFLTPGVNCLLRSVCIKRMISVWRYTGEYRGYWGFSGASGAGIYGFGTEALISNL